MRFPNKNKFGAVRCGGFDSGLERDYYKVLLLKEVAEQVSDLRVHPTVELEPGIKYKADFSFIEDGRRVWVDTKGVMGERFRLICRIWALHGPGPLRIVKRKNDRFYIARTIQGGKVK